MDIRKITFKKTQASLHCLGSRWQQWCKYMFLTVWRGEVLGCRRRRVWVWSSPGINYSFLSWSLCGPCGLGMEGAVLLEMKELKLSIICLWKQIVQVSSEVRFLNPSHLFKIWVLLNFIETMRKYIMVQLNLKCLNYTLKDILYMCIWVVSS